MESLCEDLGEESLSGACWPWGSVFEEPNEVRVGVCPSSAEFGAGGCGAVFGRGVTGDEVMVSVRWRVLVGLFG